MRQLDLQEYQPSDPLQLSTTERDLLEDGPLPLNIRPARGSRDTFVLTPESTVGALEIGDLSVLVRPKIGIPKLLSLACYAMGKIRFQESDFDLQEDQSLPDILALSLATMARRAFSRGLLHGYKREEESLHTVRGRIRMGEQLTQRFMAPLPAEVEYDDFSPDILANRLVKAASARLGRMGLRSLAVRRGLGWLMGILGDVSMVEYHPARVPSVEFNRLNEHYRRVVELSRVILRHGAFESRRGHVRANGFLMDMNSVFQEFVTVALREALGATDRTFLAEYTTKFDGAGQVNIRPDLTWWVGRDCVFAGDAKYKNATGNRIPNSDLYQALAYATALDLPGALLVYAQGEAAPAKYQVRHSGKRLEVVALDLSGSLEDTLASVNDIALQVRALANETRHQGASMRHTALGATA